MRRRQLIQRRGTRDWYFPIIIRTLFIHQNLNLFRTSMKVLVVDDEKDVEPLFRMRFRREIAKGDIELIFAFSGEEALKQLMDHGKADVVLVLSDINMPGMTGLELLRRIKEDPPPVPVCMMTAYENDEYREKAAALACDGYVSQPIDFASLKEKIVSMKSA